jgi:4-hydroxybenzoate polyprenyltransferase
MAPLVLGHALFDPTAVGRAALTFVAFCLCASSVYVLNDLLDLQADRAHPLKRARPFAAGILSIRAGLVMVPVLLGGAALIALRLPRPVAATLAAYFVLTTAYSFRLKAVAILDVVVLAVLYTLRVLAGSLAVDLEVSAWLMALSIFLFQSLAMQKRYAEFAVLEADRARLSGRGYVKDDVQLLGSAGPASGYLAVLVLALYVHSDDVIRLYAQPKVLWVVCPLVLYWVTHMWLRAHRGQITDDPIVVALTDRVSWIVGGGVVLTMLAAMVRW